MTPEHRVRFTVLALAAMLVFVPFDASSLAADDQSMDEAVAQVPESLKALGRRLHSDAYAGLGDLYARKGLCAQSSNAYRRAAELNPRSARPLEPCTPRRP